jgi:hypothetical protein
VVNEILSLKKPDGKIFCTTSFGFQSVHPMHFDLTEEKKRLVYKLAG